MKKWTKIQSSVNRYLVSYDSSGNISERVVICVDIYIRKEKGEVKMMYHNKETNYKYYRNAN